jgi:hypothetical protein
VAEAAPGDGLGVVLLRLLARPDIRAFNGEENGALVVDNAVHEYWEGRYLLDEFSQSKREMIGV